MIHEFIRLTAVSFSSDNCQTKEQQLRKFPILGYPLLDGRQQAPV